MSLCGNQVHVPASQLLENPLRFIHLLDKHRVAYTFAPNFFLTKVRDALSSQGSQAADYDLSALKGLASGGEANVVATCDALTRQLQQLGIQNEVMRPGFGMTETCAGSIVSRVCPSYDIAKGLEFASLGTCTPGIEMRVMKDDGQAPSGEIGHLQVKGPVIFDGYFNNPSATEEAFTSDGWFVTGDLARIDEQGNLQLSGRMKDTIIVNGVKWGSAEIETAIEEEGTQGLLPSFTVAFPYREKGSSTEDIAVVYSPSYADDDLVSRFETNKAISRTVSLIANRPPGHLIPLPQRLLEKSSLGKVSRTKIRDSLEKGEYTSFEQKNKDAMDEYRHRHWRTATTPTEIAVQQALSQLLSIPSREIDLDTSIFDLGLDSFNLILLRARIQEALQTKIDIPMSTLLTE